MSQLGLFGAAPPAVGPAPVSPETLALAASLPSTLRMGTSTWTFPGWSDLVYDRTVTNKVLSEEGLSAYAQHPLLRTVGIDRTFYRPATQRQYEQWAASVPDGFRFLVKAPEDCTLAWFPKIPRYGARAGKRNPRFFDPDWANEVVIRPWASGLKDRTGPLVFQLPPQSPDEVGGVEGFAERVDTFLGALTPPPATGTYALEVRNPELLSAELGDALSRHGAVPSFVVHPRMPDLRTQWRRLQMNSTGPVVVRWMLQRGLDYETARQRFSPFNQLQAPDETTRETIARLVRAMANAGRPVWVIVNNKAEGSSPLSIHALAESLRTSTPL